MAGSDATDGDEAPTVPIVCPDCGTESRIPLDDVGEAVDTHNDRLHDGAAVAQVDPAIADELADLVAGDMGLLED
jgi:hypothetical protein